MARPFLTDEAKKAFSEAVHAVESACGAELMIAVRRRSGPYREGVLAVAIVAAAAVLAFLLFSPWAFGLAWLLADPLVVGLLAGAAATRSPALLRLATSRAARQRQVSLAARAAFLDKGVHHTSRRTGVLLYISLLEREAELVTDVGLAPAVATPAWRQAATSLQEAVRRGEDGMRVAAKVHGLAAALAPFCAHLADQVNELPDEVCE